MARKVFYSFHYKRDAWRAAQVRNSKALANEDEYGVIDAVDWEKIEREGKEAIKRWINEQLKNTSVTAVLIGAETADREWVEYEIRRSWERGNGLVGVRIHGIKDQDGKADVPGDNPFDNLELKDGTKLSAVCKVYDWVGGNGLANLGKWVEEAFQLRETHKGETVLKDGDSDGSHTPSPRRSYATTGPTVIKNPAGPWAQ